MTLLESRFDYVENRASFAKLGKCWRLFRAATGKCFLKIIWNLVSKPFFYLIQLWGNTSLDFVHTNFFRKFNTWSASCFTWGISKYGVKCSITRLTPCNRLAISEYCLFWHSTLWKSSKKFRTCILKKYRIIDRLTLTGPLQKQENVNG